MSEHQKRFELDSWTVAEWEASVNYMNHRLWFYLQYLLLSYASDALTYFYFYRSNTVINQWFLDSEARRSQRAHRGRKSNNATVAKLDRQAWEKLSGTVRRTGCNSGTYPVNQAARVCGGRERSHHGHAAISSNWQGDISQERRFFFLHITLHLTHNQYSSLK